MKASELMKSLKLVLKANCVPMIFGAPGVGKSDLVRHLAETAKLKVIDIRLSQCDVTDLNGFPKLDGARASYLPMDIFPLEGDKPEAEYPNGWLLFLDELNSAPRALQASAYKLILDRMVGNHHLNKQCYVVCAGNRVEDNAIVNDLSSALKSRFVSLTLEPDVDDWLDWATTHEIDYRIIAYINFKGITGLHNFDPERDDASYACPRTWYMLSKVIKNIDTSLEEYLDLVTGTIGSVGVDFVSFCEHVGELPTFEDIAKGTDKVPASVGSRYLITASLIAKNKEITPDNAENICNYIDLLGREYAILFYLSAIKQNYSLSSIKCFQKKIQEYSTWLRK